MKSESWFYYEKYLRREWGDRLLSSISPSDVQAYFNIVRERSSISSANRVLTFAGSVFGKSCLWKDLIGENPCRGIRKGKEPNHRTRYLSSEEIARLIKVAHSRLLPVLVCALHTGMRKGEILGLDWSNVSLERNIIHILESKSGKSRQIPITSKLREVFVSLGVREQGKVFLLPNIMLRRFYARGLKDAGIFNFRFHDLRHTFASHFIMKTSNLPALKRLLGHSTPQMTQRYAHLSRGHIESEMASFGSSMPGPDRSAGQMAPDKALASMSSAQMKN